MQENQAEDMERERFLFWLSAFLTFWWMYIIFVESVGWNYIDQNSSHVVSWVMTGLWGTCLASYIGKKHFNRWGKLTDGKRFGEYLTGLVVIFAAAIFTLYMHFGTKIPDQLPIGAEFALMVLFGNEFVKWINVRRIYENGTNKQGSSSEKTTDT